MYSIEEIRFFPPDKILHRLFVSLIIFKEFVPSLALVIYSAALYFVGTASVT